MTRTFRMAARRAGPAIDWDGELNEAQRAVALAGDGPLLVVAGAGTGKTRSLTYRLARLLAEGQDPGRLLLVTFTNRAAREMLARVDDLTGGDARRIWGGTFHHVANRVLRRFGERLGLSGEFTIIDREDAADLLGGCLDAAGARGGSRRFPEPSVLLSVASLAASAGRTLETVLADRYPMFIDDAPAVTRVLERYADQKRRRQMLDYDDLLLEWLRLLEEHAGVRAELAERFRHVMVDEYQDTNPLQARVVDLLGSVHRNVCVVGDDSQSIYGFRGATVDNLLAFRDRWPDAREIRLETCYRSTPQILALANASIAVNRARLPKTLRAVRGPGVRPAVVPCADHLVQGRFVAAYILRLLEEGRDLMDIAVLYRSHWHAMEMQLELQRANIPFEVRGGRRFFEQAHLKDALGVLRLLHNGHDELAWRRVLRLFPRIGGGLAGRVWARLEGEDDPLAIACGGDLEAVLPQVARPSWRRLAALLEELRGRPAPADVLRELLGRFYGEHLEARYANGARRRQDVEALADFAAQYRTVEAFLSDAALAGDFAGETCEDGPDEQHFVTLSTVHQAKGLEWAVVIIPWMADGRFPTDMAMGTPAELEEERRVFHVALTRARDEIYLVVPQVWSNHRGRRTVMKPSRFLTELEDRSLVETMVLEADVPEVTAGERADS